MTCFRNVLHMLPKLLHLHPYCTILVRPHSTNTVRMSQTVRAQRIGGSSKRYLVCTTRMVECWVNTNSLLHLFVVLSVDFMQSNVVLSPERPYDLLSLMLTQSGWGLDRRPRTSLLSLASPPVDAVRTVCSWLMS